MASLHVLIAGGGLSGLATAQGLLRRGHTVEVFERDTDFERKQGYYLHFNAIGGNALRRVLPDDLYDLYQQTSRRTYSRTESILLDPQLQEITSMPHLGPANDGALPHTGVHRRTLRDILAARLGDALHIGAAVTSFAQDDAGVTVHTADGRTARGDVLVGADGIRSAVRQQLLPEVPVIPTGIDGIGVYGRAPLTPELDAVLPDILDQGVLMAVDNRGSRLLVGSFRPRQPADVAAAAIAPDVHLDRVEPYAMLSCSVSSDVQIPSASEWTPARAAEVRASMLSLLEGWHPAAQALVAGLDLASMFAIPFGYLEPAENWEPSRVTLVGDAAHGMLPTLGMGANLSLQDAALLVDQLDEAARGESQLLPAIGRYEEQMRAASYPVLRMTVNHDANFGGGGLAGSASR